MSVSSLALLSLIVGVAWADKEDDLSESYLLRVAKVLDLCRADMTDMTPVVEEAARRLAAGGRLWAAGQPSMVNEVTGRAGGFLLIHTLSTEVVGSGDIVLFFHNGVTPLPLSATDSAAYVISFGDGKREMPMGPWFPNHAGEVSISPTLANAIPAWVFTGELIAALTRLGKMPVLWESIGAYGAAQRNNEHLQKGLFFHETHSVPPISPGVMGAKWLDAVGAMLRRVEKEERRDISKAGDWAARAKERDKQLFMYSMGHLFPDEVGTTEIGKLFKSAVWYAGFRSSAKPNDIYAPGDVIVSIAYQHPPLDLIAKARAADARAVYVSILWDRDHKHDPGVVWIDPMWPWADACVPIPGYDVPALPASGIVNGAIAWDIYSSSKTH